MDIVIENLTKRYGSQKAVDNISLKVATGEIMGFLGPNGAGKTTTMKIITSFISPDEGKVFIGGKSLSDNSLEIKRHIGYLSENNPLYHEMPVIDFLNFCALIHGIEKHRIPDRVEEMIRITGINKEKHKKIGELSKGFQQRVGLAQAMIHNPEILIFDEPTSGLDPNQIFKSLQTIKSVSIVEFADRQLNRFNVHCKADDVKREIFRLCVDKHWVLTEMTPFETKLEDIFRELTMN